MSSSQSRDAAAARSGSRRRAPRLWHARQHDGGEHRSRSWPARHRPDRRRHRPAALAGRRLGDARRSVVRRSAALRADRRRTRRPRTSSSSPRCGRRPARRSTPRTWSRRRCGAGRCRRRVREGRIVREGDPEWERRRAGPRRGRPGGAATGASIAVLARDTNLSATRSPSALELAYLRTAGDLVQMVAEGTFPFEAGDSPTPPRRRGSVTA